MAGDRDEGAGAGGGAEEEDRGGGYTYARAGVDIAAGNALVKRIAPAARSTRRPGAEADLGGFGGLFDLKAAGFSDPILVAANDGVGTKLKLAIETGRHGTVGVDLVAMCVNDLLAQGAEPLLFLDYYATGKLEVEEAATVVEGIAEGCRQAGCALIGGETAEMPGLYAEGDYDLAGFALGALERGTALPRDDVGAGDVLIGVASSGLHSNGFSLVRRLIADRGLDLRAEAPFAPGTTLGEALLTPTRIYVKSVLPEIRAGRIKALAHVTGGGLPENLPRVLPAGTVAAVDAGTWARPGVFGWLRELGGIAEAEMLRTFNCGLGLVLAVAAPDAEAVASALAEAGEAVARIGTLEAGTPGAAPEVRISP